MKRIIAAAVALALSACAAVQPPSSYVPIVDQRGVDGARFAQDVQECQAYAHQIDVERTAANNAVAGAIVMGILSAALGGHTRANLGWAAAGAAAGAANGAAVAGMTQVQIIQRCMMGRGYNVLAAARAAKARA